MRLLCLTFVRVHHSDSQRQKLYKEKIHMYVTLKGVLNVRINGKICNQILLQRCSAIYDKCLKLFLIYLNLSIMRNIFTETELSYNNNLKFYWILKYVVDFRPILYYSLNGNMEEKITTCFEAVFELTSELHLLYYTIKKPQKYTKKFVVKKCFCKYVP